MATDRVRAALDEFKAALEEAGMDPATVDAQLAGILPGTPTVVGNYADLQRMGAAVVTGTVPTGPGMDDVASSDLAEAFVTPPDPGVRDAFGDGGAASPAMPVAPATGTGTPAPAPTGDLSSMTKAELADHAAAQGVAGADPATMTKQEMVDHIQSQTGG